MSGDAGSGALAPLLAPDELRGWSDEQRTQGLTVVFTNGCYDLFHPGHAASLRAARGYGDLLLVAINSDASVRALKGEGRPLLDEGARSNLLRSLRAVDAVTIFSDPSVLPTILTVRPDVVAKGGQYDTAEIVGSEEVEQWGGRVVRLPMVEGVSTTLLIDRIRSLTPTAGEGKEDP
jgi:rfaE bifunctional protein nucleotidyltransferase chain/domain